MVVIDNDFKWVMEDMFMLCIMGDMIILLMGEVLIINGVENGF